MVDNKKNNIDIQTDKIIFDIQSNSTTNYYMSLELYDTIDIENSIYTIEEKYIKMDLVKINSLSWNSLLKDKNMYKNNIKVNWQNWDDSDDSDDDSDDNKNLNQSQYENQNQMNGNQQFDFHKMMESMGGIGNMGEMLKNMNLGNSEEGNDDEEGNDEEGNDEEEHDEEGNDEEGNDEEGNDEEDYCYDCN
jgi:hypothetical protein